MIKQKATKEIDEHTYTALPYYGMRYQKKTLNLLLGLENRQDVLFTVFESSRFGHLSGSYLRRICVHSKVIRKSPNLLLLCTILSLLLIFPSAILKKEVGHFYDNSKKKTLFPSNCHTLLH